MKINNFDSKILSSSHLNFLFGAGVNGLAFPQMNKFKRSIDYLEKLLGKKITNFETGIDELKSNDDKEKVYNIFKEEFKKVKIDLNNSSIKNIESLFCTINKLVENSENRTKTTKQINVYTLNYDSIVEDSLNRLGYLSNTISSSNIFNHDKFFDMVGYNYSLNKFVPTYLISKLHGNIDNPILPGINKYDSVMQANRFEIIFKMKEKLSRFNSILFVIGYSGYDEHINKILKDCVLAGLTIYWFKYSEEDYVPSNLSEHIFTIENDDKVDTTLVCAKMVNNLWVKSSEE